jgi:hypothetical protein
MWESKEAWSERDVRSRSCSQSWKVGSSEILERMMFFNESSETAEQRLIWSDVVVVVVGGRRDVLRFWTEK